MRHCKAVAALEIELPYVRPSGDTKCVLGLGVLVVDDDPAVMAYVTAVLDAFSVRPIVIAATEPEAFLCWRDHASEIDVLLCDLQLGSSSGQKLASMLVSQKPELEVVIMTGDMPDKAALEKAIGKPIQILLKPFIPSKLMEVLRSAASSSRDPLSTKPAGR